MSSHGRRTTARAWQSPGRVGATPKDFKPFRDRAVPSKNMVPCPVEFCGAAIGEPCRNAAGAEQTTCHHLRRKMAVRLQNRLTDPGAPEMAGTLEEAERIQARNIENLELPD